MVGWHHRLNGREFEPCQETVPGRGARGLPSRGRRADAAERQQLTCSVVCLRCTVQWCGDTRVHSLCSSLTFPPVWVIAEPWAEFPPLHSRSLLVIHGSVHMFPQTPHGSLSSAFPPQSESLVLFCKYVLLHHCSDWTLIRDPVAFFFLWLILLTVTICRSIPVPANGTVSFFKVAEQYPIVNTHTTSLSIHQRTQVASTSWLLQCCFEHKGACIFSNYGFLWIYAQEWGC